MNENNIDENLKEARAILSSVNGSAYKDLFLLSNEVLSKNPFNNNFLNRFLNDEKPVLSGYGRVFYKFLAYYIKSLFHFISYMFRFAEYAVSPARYPAIKKGSKLILIDTVFNMDVIRRSRSFKELFFQGVEGVLKKEGAHYAYLPIFYSASYYRKPFEIYGTLKILKKEKVPVLTEFQLLSPIDLLRIFYFMIAYPFHVLKFSRAIKADTRGLSLLQDELINTLDNVTFLNFSRYLQGKRIAALPCDTIKVISWYENRPVHKNLYKALREGPADIKIYGSQLFLYPKDFLTINADENEKQFGVVPDKIIANGPYYMPKNSGLNYALGPSLRYSKIFQMKVRDEDRKNILVLLPFLFKSAVNILRLIKEADLKSYSVIVKSHPAIPVERLNGYLPDTVSTSEKDIYELFESTKIVVGAATGTMIEAVSLRIPAITVKNGRFFDHINPLPEYGKGKVWEEASGPKDLLLKIGRMESFMENNPEEMRAIADEYKRMFFCEVNEESIKKAFDI